MKRMLNTIKQAAIRQDGKIFTTPRPGRHRDILQEMVDIGVYGGAEANEQGFLTEDGQFVDRITAAEIAIRCGQINKKQLTMSRLYSEDLW